MLTTCQRFLKTNPEYVTESKLHENDYIITLKVLNQSLIRFHINCENKSDAKKSAAFEALSHLFPLAFKWILLHAKPNLDVIKKSIKDFKTDDSNQEADPRTEHFKALYARYDAEIERFEICQNFLKEKIFIDQPFVKKNYLDQLKGENFSSVACKIHQHFTKDSLKINQIMLDLKKYEATVDFGGKTLIKITVNCKEKTICKKIAALKYIEIYCFETFKAFYEQVIGSVCPMPDYIKDIENQTQARKKKREKELGMDSDNQEDDSLSEDLDDDSEKKQ